jgi:hypothetical protein
MDIPHSERNELDKIHDEFNQLLEPEYSSLIVSAVAGSRANNSKYHYAIYKSGKISLFEKSATKSFRFEFDFSTHQFENDGSELPPAEIKNFTQTLASLITKIHTGKATLLKKI